MIKAVIFDADGVLINGEMFSVQLARDCGITTEQTLPFFTGTFKDCIVGKADLKEVLIPYLHKWGWNKSVDDFIDYWHRSEHNIDSELINYIQILRKNGIICCLGTNQTKFRFNYMLKEMGFEKSFDKVYVSAHIGYKKPNREFYEHILYDLKDIKKEEVVFWDDTLENVEGARQFGIHAEVYTSFDNFSIRMQKYLET
jgi:putative hydrolase of the HAD superfamily